MDFMLVLIPVQMNSRQFNQNSLPFRGTNHQIWPRSEHTQIRTVIIALKTQKYTQAS